LALAMSVAASSRFLGRVYVRTDGTACSRASSTVTLKSSWMNSSYPPVCTDGMQGSDEAEPGHPYTHN
jgi:hypothetical protein